MVSITFYSFVKLFNHKYFLYLGMMNGSLIISSEHIRMYTTIMGRSNTNVARSARGRATHHEAKKTLIASYFASPPAGKIPQITMVLME